MELLDIFLILAIICLSICLITSLIGIAVMLWAFISVKIGKWRHRKLMTRLTREKNA